MKVVYLIILFLPASSFLNPKLITYAAPVANTKQQPAASLITVDSKGAKAALTKQPQIILLDVRTPQEYAGGHLKNAYNLNYNAPDFADKLAKLDKTKPYLVYCAVGGRSGKAAKLMQQMGFKQIINVSEGYTNLKNAGHAVVD
ncbi:MAG: rhodanese-like domain-containing protein [Adhaeribacter sp.]